MENPEGITYGRIVIVEDLVDPRGGTPKNRACVVATPTAFISAGRPIDVVAISTRFPTRSPPITSSSRGTPSVLLGPG